MKASQDKTTALTAFDWNFDGVPDGELVACCYWEYARESAFIRNLRQRCLANWKAGARHDEKLSDDMAKLASIGDGSAILLRGIYFGPDDPHRIDKPDAAPVTNSFPLPWLSLPATEREFRTRAFLLAGWRPVVPFKQGDWLEAREIAEQAEKTWKRVYSAFEKVRRENPGLSEVQLIEHGKLQPYEEIRPSLFYEDGKEVTVVEIDWQHFTNEEIIKGFRCWVKSHRPKEIPVPKRQGHKPGDWRMQLTRLAVMRLLSRFTPLQLVVGNRVPAIWETKQFAGRKWGDITKWHDARREGAKVFHTLFPFLPPTKSLSHGSADHPPNSAVFASLTRIPPPRLSCGRDVQSENRS